MQSLKENSNVLDDAKLVEKIYVWAREGARQVLRGRSPEAEDVVQQLCVRLLEKGKQLAGIDETALQGYVRVAARHLALNFVRAEGVRQRFSSEQKLIQKGAARLDEPSERGEESDALRSAISRLDEDEQALIVMKFVEGKTSAEMAAKLGITEGAARTRLYRIISKLRDFLSSGAGCDENGS